jgi:gas vesicle protein
MTDAQDRDHTEGSGWDAGSFATGLLLGAAVGAGVALLLAPASGRKTRRRLRRGASDLIEDAGEGLASARDEARALLRDKKAALLDRLGGS